MLNEARLNEIFNEHNFSKKTCELYRNFASLRLQGLSIHDISKHFGVSTNTVYEHLQNIAYCYGVTREELLYIPHNSYKKNSDSTKQIQQLTSLDALELKSLIEKLIIESKSILSTLKEV